MVPRLGSAGSYDEEKVMELSYIWKVELIGFDAGLNNLSLCTADVLDQLFLWRGYPEHPRMSSHIPGFSPLDATNP